MQAALELLLGRLFDDVGPGGHTPQMIVEVDPLLAPDEVRVVTTRDRVTITLPG